MFFFLIVFSWKVKQREKKKKISHFVSLSLFPSWTGFRNKSWKRSKWEWKFSSSSGTQKFLNKFLAHFKETHRKKVHFHEIKYWKNEWKNEWMPQFTYLSLKCFFWFLSFSLLLCFVSWILELFIKFQIPSPFFSWGKSCAQCAMCHTNYFCHFVTVFFSFSLFFSFSPSSVPFDTSHMLSLFLTNFSYSSILQHIFWCFFFIFYFIWKEREGEKRKHTGKNIFLR